jgi:ATP-binding cassette, subfamily B, bacterial PglK
MSLKTKNMLVDVRACFNLLERSDKRKYKAVVLIQAVLGILDLLGVALLGVIGALSIRGIQSQGPGDKVSKIIEFMHLENFSFQMQVLIISLIAVSLMISKTGFSIYASKKVLFFLSRRSAEISKLLLSKVLNQPLVIIQKSRSYEVQYAAGPGVSSLVLGVLGTLSNALADASLLLIIGVGVFFVDPLVAVLSFLIFGTVTGVVYLLMRGRARKLGEEITSLNINSNKLLSDVFSTYRELYVRNRRQEYVNKIYKAKVNAAEALAEQTFMPFTSKYVIEISVLLGAFFVAALEFSTTDASRAAASLAVFFAAGTRIAPALLRIQQSVISVQANLGASSSTLQMLRETRLDQSSVESNSAPDFVHSGFVPEVTLTDVSFRYDPQEDFTIRNLNLHIMEGEFVALVGPSGGGKSTVIDLMLGLNTPESGFISVSGSAPAETINNFPGAISYVPQQVGISDDTIASNIAMGYSSNEIREERITEALRLAHLLEFVKTLPNGVHSIVGENGSNLSGGQRQRIGIARAFYTNPKMVILDEATSALDGKTELDISDALAELQGLVTVVVVAHRLSTVRSANKVVYIDKGQIVAQGTFEEVRAAVPDFNHQAQLMGL